MVAARFERKASLVEQMINRVGVVPDWVVRMCCSRAGRVSE
jgi:hypothetical protein